MHLIVKILSWSRRLCRSPLSLQYFVHLCLVHGLLGIKEVELLCLELELVLQQSLELHRLWSLFFVKLVCKDNLLFESFEVLLAVEYVRLYVHEGGHQHVMHRLKVSGAHAHTRAKLWNLLWRL